MSARLTNDFLGHVTEVRSFGRVRVSESVYRGHVRLPVHAHPGAFLSFVVDGGYVETVGRRRIPCERNVLRYHPAGEEHADAFGGSGGRCLNIELADELSDVHPSLREHPVTVDFAAWLALRVRRELRRPDGVASILVEELVLELLDQCVAQARRSRSAAGSAALRRAIDYVESHLGDALTLTGLAAVAGVHDTHLARLFRHHLGLTAGEYVRRRRIARAEVALRLNPSMTAASVAAALGFADLAHFSRTFRRIVGVTPTEYRRACK